MSAPVVPFTVDACRPQPSVPPRSASTRVTSVPASGLTVRWSVPPSMCTVTCSTSFVSMTMVATSRVRRRRLPLADRSNFSAALEPWKSSVSVPAWPSTTSLLSPGFHTKVSSPLPRKATSFPRPPVTVSLSSPPSRVSLPSPPVIVSGPGPPSSTSGVSVDRPFPARIVSAPPSVCTSIVSLMSEARTWAKVEPPSMDTSTVEGVADRTSWTLSGPAVPVGKIVSGSAPPSMFRLSSGLTPRKNETLSLPARVFTCSTSLAGSAFDDED